MKNVELTQCVDHLQDENCKLREVLSWLSTQEPQLGVLIASYKCFDGWDLGSNKFGESSGEREGKFGNVSVPSQPTPKDKFASKPNQLLKPREKPSEKADEKPSEKPSGKPSEKPCEEPHPKPKPKPIRLREGERREWLRSGQTRTGTSLLMVCLSLVCHYLRERFLCVRFRLGE
jgi:hypothetical protein